MSLNSTKPDAKKEFVALMTDMRSKKDVSDEEYADRFIDLLEKWLNNGTIKYLDGLVAGTNKVIGVFNGKLE